MPNEARTSAALVSGARAELEQGVRPGARELRDLAGHREHLASLFEREIRRDQGAAALARLDDDRRRAQPGDDAVARREPPGRRLDAGRVLRDDQARARRRGARARRARRGSRGRCRSRGLRPSSRPPRARRDAPRRRCRARGRSRRRARPRRAPARGCARPRRRSRSTRALPRSPPPAARGARARRRRAGRAPPAGRGSRAAAAGSSGADRGTKRYPRAASRSRYARSSKRRSKARQRSPRGGRTRCVPVSEAKTASASSDISRARPASDRRAPRRRARPAPSSDPASAAIVRATRPTRA